MYPYFYIQIIICIFGLLTNLVNIIVFLNIKKRTKIQNINFVWSILDFLYLSSMVLCFIVYLKYPDTVFSKTIICCIDIYFSNSIILTIICLQIFVYSRHYLRIKKKEFFFIKTSINVFIYLIIFLFIGLIVHLPVVFISKIIQVPINNISNEKIYIIKQNFEVGEELETIYLMMITCIRCSVSLVLVIMLNMMIYVKYKKVLTFSKSKLPEKMNKFQKSYFDYFLFIFKTK